MIDISFSQPAYRRDALMLALFFAKYTEAGNKLQRRCEFFVRLVDIGRTGDILKETPHNARGPLAGEFQPLAACKNLDYPPGKLKNLQAADVGKGNDRCAAVLCGTSLKWRLTGEPSKNAQYDQEVHIDEEPCYQGYGRDRGAGADAGPRAG